MEISVLHYTPLEVCSTAIRTCWNSHDKSDKLNACGQIGCSRYQNNATDPFCVGCEFERITIGEKDKDLIDRVGNKFKHSSTLEHIVYTFYIKGISRALLQELARHRVASLSVKSTRYTLKELKKEESFHGLLKSIEKRAAKYLVLTGVGIVDVASIRALENLRQVLTSEISTDKAKYCLPEAYKTELTLTINARSLQNFLRLRTDKSALWEIRDLAKMIYRKLPEDHKYLFEDCVKT